MIIDPYYVAKLWALKVHTATYYTQVAWYVCVHVHVCVCLCACTCARVCMCMFVCASACGYSI